MRRTDVLVVGSGMAGLVAALTAARRGRSVRLVTRGAGALAVSGGCVDVLGYIDGKPVRGDPLAAVSSLPDEHPYRIMGVEALAEALDFFTRLCREYSLDLGNDVGENLWIPTIIGTFRPSFLCPPAMDRNVLTRVETSVIPHMPWLKDSHAFMARENLQCRRRFRDKRFLLPEIASPFPASRRSLTPLDMAHRIDTGGEDWLLERLAQHTAPYAKDGVAILLPPILGLNRHAAVRQRLSAELGCDLVEMAVSPPGVGGLRIRGMLVRALEQAGVSVVENARITEARVEGRECKSLVCDALGKESEIEADAFIIATGGFLGGGHVAEPGAAREAIFDLDLGAPATVEAWSSPEFFGPQPYARLGVKVDRRLNALSPTGQTLWENVFFAGRALAGYDFVMEKSGNGVALASGHYAGGQC